MTTTSAKQEAQNSSLPPKNDWRVRLQAMNVDELKSSEWKELLLKMVCELEEKDQEKEMLLAARPFTGDHLQAIELQRFMEFSPDIICTIDHSGLFQKVSKAAFRILGYEPQEMEGKHFSLFLHPEDLAPTESAAKMIIEQGTKFDFENRYLHKTGASVPLMWSIMWDEQQGVFYCIGRDASERKEADKKLKQSEELLSEAQRLAKMGSWNFDFREDRLTWSEGLYSVFGVDKSGFLETHKSFIDLVDEEDRSRVLETSQQSQVSGEPFHVQYRITTPNGEQRIIEEYGYSEKDASGKIVRLFGTAQDITERKKAEQARQELTRVLEQHMGDLERSNAELEQFAYVASHDLQEPLRMVTGFLSNLERKYGAQLDGKGIEYIRFAMDGALRMRRVILDLLEYSRVGRTEERIERVDIRELLNEYKMLRQKLLEEKAAELVFGSLPVLWINRAPLQQLFYNILDNALKYNKPHVPPLVEVQSWDDEKYWYFSVQDNGIGISPEYFEKIFVIFQRLHDRSAYEGNGLGLAIVQKIVNSFQGKVWLESTPNEGTTFYFTIKKTETTR